MNMDTAIVVTIRSQHEAASLSRREFRSLLSAKRWATEQLGLRRFQRPYAVVELGDEHDTTWWGNSTHNGTTWRLGA